MSNATRINDGTTGICDVGEDCCPHERAGTNATGSPDVFINGLAAHRRGDTGPTNCPHAGTFRSVGCSSTVFINGRGATRISDGTVCIVCGCGGEHSSGSPNVFIGG